ncbi:Domain of unknown function DUF1933 (plasmid) [Pantoea sp. At-9b]|nr:Domain of unknown function DUF1933 [Pantoea sp. At-9b]
MNKNGFCFLFKSKKNHKFKRHPFPGGHIINLSLGELYISTEANFQVSTDSKHSAYLIGSIYNRNFLVEIASMWESHAYVFNDSELLITLYSRLGQSALTLAEGDFNFIIEEKNERLHLFSDSQGLSTAYLVESKFTWLTNTLKVVSFAEGEDALQFACESLVCQSELRPDNYSPVTNATRFKPGSYVILSRDREHYIQSDINTLNVISNSKELILKKQDAIEIIDKKLNTPLNDLSQKYSSIGIPLSGGLDSSLITALASRYFDQIFTYSIGTEFSNEFEFSKIVSDSLNTNHHVHILSDSEVVEGIVNAIFHNEIFDGLSAEIQSGLFNIYKLSSGKVKSMITGYGSDLLFGGILNPDEKYNNPNSLLDSQIYRTRWTGEFSTNGAKHFGIEVRHPFWNQKLITLCKSLAPEFKIKNNEVKNILREYTDSLALLPPEIIWRKKLESMKVPQLIEYLLTLLVRTSITISSNHVSHTEFIKH